MLTGENAQHAKVLRLKAGETVLVCDGQDEYLCEVMDAGEMKLNVASWRESRRKRQVGQYYTSAFPRRTSWHVIEGHRVGGLRDRSVPFRPVRVQTR